MKVRVERIRDAGTLDRERLVLRVLATTDIGYYALLRTKYDAETVLAGNCDAFWFPFGAVHKDDLVVGLHEARSHEGETLGGWRQGPLFLLGA